ncbi:major facilitator superfamily domain-containing protein [Aspergillus ambiguus]|uniref:putative MFS transporter n=1 Tax=Aspergillus ambiguus TaxID=176160 RepID=UPI003CCDAA61
MAKNVSLQVLELPGTSDSSSLNSSVTRIPSGPHDSRTELRAPDTPNTLVQEFSNSSDPENPAAGHGWTETSEDDQYKRFSTPRKLLIVATLSFCALLAPISSTAILAAVPELAKTYQTTPEVINASTALYLASMGAAALFWGPLSQVYGRRPVFISSSILFFAFTIATTLSPNLATYFLFRALTAFQGTSFLVVGNSVIGDIYEPQVRATALGWILSGSMVGPAFGPFLGGVVITFRPWRTIFWLLTAMAGVAALAIIFIVPETIPFKSNGEFIGQSLPKQTRALWRRISPVRVITLNCGYPNLFLTGLATGALVWCQYALLTPIRPILNPRFHLTTPIQAGLFYLAPGCGYLVGNLIGGRWADHVVRKYITRRNGIRIPEDRLRSCLVPICVLTPGSILVYGWTLDQDVGGIPAPVVAMFVQGVAQLLCLPSLNTYCLDVMHSNGRSAEVVAGSYVFRYVFAALGTGVALPGIQTLGVGWFNTISALFLLVCGGTVWLTAIYGARWREAVEWKYEQRSTRRKEAALGIN